MRLNQRLFQLICAATSFSLVAGNLCEARTVLRNICRIKGQEENVVRGLGLVVGLPGTGAVDDPQTMRALATAMDIMGSPIPDTTPTGQSGLQELAKVKNVALAWVTASVPASGARRGDQLDCYVSLINGKSLAGGRLAFAALQGPNTQDRRIFALCEGAIQIEDEAMPTVGKIHNGCQMEEDVFTPFVNNGHITLILERNHANFQIARDVAEHIRSQFSRNDDEDLVHAYNQSNIVVKIPDEYRNDHVAFAADILEIAVYSPDPEARVIINEKTNDIAISGDVTIGDIVVAHGTIVVEAGQTLEFQAVQSEDSNPAKLQSLVKSLTALKVPPADIVAVIKNIERSGKLHGKLIIW